MPDLGAAPVSNRRARPAADGWRAPQHRAGFVLLLGAAGQGLIGLVFWVLAARLYDPAAVGVGAAALSAVTFLASVSHLNIGNAMVRFVPVADRRGAVVVGCLAVGAGCGAVAGLGFGVGANVWAPDLVTAFGYAGLIGFTTVGVSILTVFGQHEAALTAIKRVDVVLLEKVAFALLQVGLLAVGAWLGVAGAIATGTVAAALIVVPVVTGWMVLTLRRRSAPAGQVVQSVTARDVAGFAGVDYAGYVCWQAAVSGLPLVLIALVGAEGAAVYGVAWSIVSVPYLVVNYMGMAMVAHTAGRDDAAVTRARRGMERLTMIIVVLGAALVAAGAHIILGLFGRSYVESGAALLVLLALSAIPNVITNGALWEARVRRRRAVQFGLPAAIGAVAVAVTLVLAPVVGTVGAGWAWLTAQCLVATVVLVRRRAVP